MISALAMIIGFGVGYFIGARKKKVKITQIGGDNAMQIGIVNDKSDDDCAKFPVW